MSARGGSLAILLAVAGCATAPVSGAERKIVEAEGWAAEEGPAAGDRALADAQKRAVEKALGVKLAASTRIEAAVAVRRRIWADARGRVESWTVLGERTAGGFRVIRIRAVVRRLAEDEEVPPPAETTVRIEAAGPAEAGLRRGFGARGFNVVERGGDFVVKARSSSGLLRDERTAPFVSGRGRVSVSVIDAASGGVVWEEAREAGGLDLDPLTASALAVESAGELGGRAAADGLSRILWNR
jgi:hypothetical protein